MTKLFHAALPSDWRQAQAGGLYLTSTRGVTLADEGFVHCSYPHQIERVANTVFGDLDEIMLLEMDTDDIGAPVVEENLEGGDEMFPHIYRPIDVAWVDRERAWRRSDDGVFRLVDLDGDLDVDDRT